MRGFSVLLVLLLASLVAAGDGRAQDTPAAASSGAGAGGVTAAGDVLVIDDFEGESLWTPHPADGVDLALRFDTGRQGRALRLDFDFHGGGGYAVARRPLDLDLSGNFVFEFQIRGQAPVNHLEFKLMDETGENVWWSVRRDLQFPEEWTPLRIKKRQIQFAWGPLGGGELRHAAALEIVITAGSGGNGTVWVDDLILRRLPPPTEQPPAVTARASSSNAGCPPELALDAFPVTYWQPMPDDPDPWIAFDLGALREYGGLVLDWAPGLHAREYRIEASWDPDGGAGSAVLDSVRWRPIRSVRESNGGRDYFYLPESESRWIRLRVGPVSPEESRPEGEDAVEPALAGLTLQPLSWSATRAAFFQEIAKDVPRGLYPRALSGEQSYWTVVGADFDTQEGLLNEDGMLETGRGEFSIEPFLFAEGRLLGWRDVWTVPSLEEGDLPIPTVEWRADSLRVPLGLTVTAFAAGKPGASFLVARYRVRNRGAQPVEATLYLALRPFQVNPPAQFLNLAGGTAPIHSLSLVAEGNAERSGSSRRTLRVNGVRELFSLRRPSAFGAAPFDGGDIAADYLRFGKLPAEEQAADSFAACSGAWAYTVRLAPGTEEEIQIVIPLHEGSPLPRTLAEKKAGSWTKEQFERTRKEWRERVGRVTLRLPEQAAWVAQSMRSQLAFILVNRAGPAIQPGTRSYARSWIRDGSLTSSALLRLGHPEAARAFLEWYAPHQYENGKIPCVVDARGADPVPEHDSSGEFIFLVAEYYRFTRDGRLLEHMYPRVLAAAAYLDSLRRERRTPEYRTPEKAEFFGILPPSISHEGYSAKPMHSYWDDFFALRGFRDAVYLAGERREETDRARLAAIAEEFEGDLVRSIEAAMRRHEIDFIPGSADLGDFDATSTTIALSPAGAGPILPREALHRTFEKYFEFFTARREGAPWEAFTPYEIRNIGAFVRLGWRERAGELLDFFLSTQRPPEWRQWPEVVWQDAAVPRFLGDLPHTWVGSDFVRSLLDMIAYVEESDGSLVLGAGVREEWLTEEPGLILEDYPTPYGTLDFRMARVGRRGPAPEGATADGTPADRTVAGGKAAGATDRREVLARIRGDLKLPPGGIRLIPPPGALRARVNGKPAAEVPPEGLRLASLPAEVRFQFAPEP